jgi:RHS repeat-associated protein
MAGRSRVGRPRCWRQPRVSRWGRARWATGRSCPFRSRARCRCNGHAYAFVTDNLGSVTHLIDTTRATQAAYAYHPYGNQVSKTGGEDLFNLLGYTGALTDPAPDQGAASTGYTHLGNRWQNPATGSFTQQDSLSELANPANGNRYAYAADNPANYVDPTGQSFWTGFVTAIVFEAVVAVTCSVLVVGFTGGIGAGATVGCFYLGAATAAWAGYAGGQG